MKSGQHVGKVLVLLVNSTYDTVKENIKKLNCCFANTFLK